MRQLLFWSISWSLVMVLPPGAVASQQPLQTHIHVKYTIARGEDTKALLEEAQALMAWTLANQVSSNMGKFVSDLVMQLNKTHTQLHEIAIKSSDKTTRVPRSFTEGKKKVADMKKLQSRKCTVKTLSVGEVEQLVHSRVFRLSEPVVLRNGSGCCINEADLRRWTAESMSSKEFSDVKVNFISSPRDKQLFRVGVRVPRKDISFTNYLNKCFSNKLPGSGTENCELDLPLRSWLPAGLSLDFTSRYDNVSAKLGGVNPWSRLVSWREHILERGSEDIMTIIESITGNDEEERRALIEHFYASQRRLVVGPSGSGEPLRPNPIGEVLVDSLLHGSRRWLIVPYSELLRVSASAKEALEPTSAFMFFEEKLVELREEFGLKDYRECQQHPGDVVVVPRGFWSVSLATKDSISLREPYVDPYDKERIVSLVHSLVFNPEARVYSKIFCLGQDEIKDHPNMADEAKNGFSQLIIDTQPLVQALEILGVLTNCAGVQYAVGGIVHGGECDDDTWRKCRARLSRLVRQASSEMGERSAVRRIDISFPYIPLERPGPISPPGKRDDVKHDEL